MKKKLIIISGIVVLLIGILLSVYFIMLSSVTNKSEKVEFKVANGSTTNEIIANLKDANLIKNELFTKIYLKLHPNIVIKAGKYDLDRSYSTIKIMHILGGGLVTHKTISVTFIEGKRLLDYVDDISEKFGYEKEDILKVLSDKTYLQELIDKYDFLTKEILNSEIYYPLEGYLFPDTYEFFEDASIKTIIEKMLDKMEIVLDNYSTAIEKSGRTIHEILTIASIIENETMYESDREYVSQVINKRLSINMSLGMDVTSAYGAKITLKELDELDKAGKSYSVINADNPYNTRRTNFAGLPVGPISSPSEGSINAALNPSNTDYVYFYADSATGKLHFAKTYSEFQGLIRKYS